MKRPTRSLAQAEAQLVDEHQADSIAAHVGLSGAEVHRDCEIV
jgi:hypothetical protein